MSPSPRSPFRRLIREFHRRSLWQVLGIYLVGGWVAFEVVQTLTEGLGLPEWFPPLAIVLLLIGLPVVLATAFVQEAAPAEARDPASSTGVDEEDGEELGSAARVFTWRNAALGGVGAFALWGVAAAGWVLFGEAGAGGGSPTEGGGPAAAEQSVAVLPFENMSGNPDNEYFSDGITEEILNALAQIPDLRVPGRTSSFAFKDQNVTIRQIADTLGVAHVVEGSVRRAGDRVLITAQLVDARTDAHLWSDTYERQLDDVFAIQREIAAAVAGQLQVTLSGDQEARIAAGATGSPEARDLHLQGKQLLYRRTRDGILGAIDAFERAVEADPTYAPAAAGLALAYNLGETYARPEPDSIYAWEGRALAYANRAIALDSSNAEAWAVRGRIGGAGASPEQVERDFRRALELRPSYAEPHGWYGGFLAGQERPEEALEAATRAVELDPLSPGMRLSYATTATRTRRYDLALEQLRRLRAIQPDSPLNSGPETLALLLLGRIDECLELNPSNPHCLHAAGRVAEAEARVGALMAAWNRGEASPGVRYVVMNYFAWTGQLEETLRWVRRSFQVAPRGTGPYVWSGLWDPVLEQDEERVRSTLEHLRSEAWERVRRESRRAESALIGNGR